jgi:hypothetical protein
VFALPDGEGVRVEGEGLEERRAVGGGERHAVVAALVGVDARIAVGASGVQIPEARIPELHVDVAVRCRPVVGVGGRGQRVHVDARGQPAVLHVVVAQDRTDHDTGSQQSIVGNIEPGLQVPRGPVAVEVVAEEEERLGSTVEDLPGECPLVLRPLPPSPIRAAVTVGSSGATRAASARKARVRRRPDLTAFSSRTGAAAFAGRPGRTGG